MPLTLFSREIASQISRENYPIVSGPTLHPHTYPVFHPLGYIIGFLFHLFIPSSTALARFLSLFFSYLSPFCEPCKAQNGEKLPLEYCEPPLPLPWTRSICSWAPLRGSPHTPTSSKSTKFPFFFLDKFSWSLGYQSPLYFFCSQTEYSSGVSSNHTFVHSLNE